MNKKIIGSYKFLNNENNNDSIGIILPSDNENNYEVLQEILDKVYKNKEKLKEVEFLYPSIKQYEYIVNYFKTHESSTELTACFDPYIPIKEVAHIAKEEVKVSNIVDCFNIYSIPKEDRGNLSNFVYNQITDTNENMEVELNELLDIVDKIVDELNTKGESDIEKILLLDDFYYKYFSYDKKFVKQKNKLDKKIDKLSKKKKVNQKELDKYKQKRDELGTSPHYISFLIKNNKGVCSAFSMLSYLIFSNPKLNMNVYYAESKEVNHAWNAFLINEKLYLYDFTSNLTSNLKLGAWYLINYQNLYNRISLSIKKSKQFKKIKNNKTISNLVIHNKELIEKSSDKISRLFIGDRFVNEVSLVKTNKYRLDPLNRDTPVSTSTLDSKKLLDAYENIKDKHIEVEEITSHKR